MHVLRHLIASMSIPLHEEFLHSGILCRDTHILVAIFANSLVTRAATFHFDDESGDVGNV